MKSKHTARQTHENEKRKRKDLIIVLVDICCDANCILPCKEQQNTTLAGKQSRVVSDTPVL